MTLTSTCIIAHNEQRQALITSSDHNYWVSLNRVESKIKRNVESIYFDICQDLRGGSKRTYVGGVPPNTPPCAQWGALNMPPWVIRRLTPWCPSIFVGVPPTYVRFDPPLKSWYIGFDGNWNTFSISFMWTVPLAVHQWKMRLSQASQASIKWQKVF